MAKLTDTEREMMWNAFRAVQKSIETRISDEDDVNEALNELCFVLADIENECEKMVQ